MDFSNLKLKDKKIMEAIEMEIKRQNNGIELIASENFVSSEVMEAMGSQLTINMQKAILGEDTMGAVNM